MCQNVVSKKDIDEIHSKFNLYVPNFKFKDLAADLKNKADQDQFDYLENTIDGVIKNYKSFIQKSEFHERFNVYLKEMYQAME